VWSCRDREDQVEEAAAFAFLAAAFALDGFAAAWDGFVAALPSAR
jgi:hypothetical protein